MSDILLKKVTNISFFISLIFLIKTLTLDLYYVNKGYFNVHKPIAYIDKLIDLYSTGITQEFTFKNSIKGEHNVEIKIILPKSRAFNDSIPNKFEGEYKIILYKNNTLVNQAQSCGTIREGWTRISHYNDIGGHYYTLARFEINEEASHTLKIENLRGLSTYKNVKFKLIVSPIEYNLKIPRRNFNIQLLVWGLVLIFSSLLKFRS